MKNAMSETALGLPLQKRPQGKVNVTNGALNLPLLKADNRSHPTFKITASDNFMSKISDYYNHDVDTHMSKAMGPQICGTEMRIDLNTALGAKKIAQLASKGHGSRYEKKSVAQKSVEILHGPRGGLR